MCLKALSLHLCHPRGTSGGGAVLTAEAVPGLLVVLLAEPKAARFPLLQPRQLQAVGLGSGILCFTPVHPCSWGLAPTAGSLGLHLHALQHGKETAQPRAWGLPPVTSQLCSFVNGKLGVTLHASRRSPGVSREKETRHLAAEKTDRESHGNTPERHGAIHHAPSSPAFPRQPPPAARKPCTRNKHHFEWLSKQSPTTQGFSIFMQSRLAPGPRSLYLSNVCAVGDEFIEEVLLEDNTHKGEEEISEKSGGAKLCCAPSLLQSQAGSSRAVGSPSSMPRGDPAPHGEGHAEGSQHTFLTFSSVYLQRKLLRRGNPSSMACWLCSVYNAASWCCPTPGTHSIVPYNTAVR